MGNQKQKWTAEEEEALLNGVAKHGPGKWKNILKDPDFAPFLTQRSNIDLKDKWRNLSVSTTQQGSHNKLRISKIKAIAAAAPHSTPNSAPAALVSRNVSSNTVVMGDLSDAILVGKNGPKYNAMIFEAISTMKETNGSDLSSIVNYIEERHEVPPNFRRLLSAKLRRLVSQGKLEKVQNCYKLRRDTTIGSKTPPKQKETKSRVSQNAASRETVEEAAIAAAYRIAEAENKAFLAAEAVKEAERVSKMAEDTEAMLQLVEHICEKCSRGEIVVLA